MSSFLLAVALSSAFAQTPPPATPVSANQPFSVLFDVDAGPPPAGLDWQYNIYADGAKVATVPRPVDGGIVTAAVPPFKTTGAHTVAVASQAKITNVDQWVACVAAGCPESAKLTLSMTVGAPVPPATTPKNLRIVLALVARDGTVGLELVSVDALEPTTVAATAKVIAPPLPKKK